MKYQTLQFDDEGFWDSEQFEDELPIQFWRDEIPDQIHLDVLLKAWNNQSVYYTAISGDTEEFDAIEKLLYDLECDLEDCGEQDDVSLRVDFRGDVVEIGVSS